jgi:DNA-directed RNA polymerase subunit RPC12/RpoP
MAGEETSDLTHRKTWHAGETVPAGGYVCVQCATRVNMEHEGVLHPCPQCHGKKFVHP